MKYQTQKEFIVTGNEILNGPEIMEYPEVSIVVNRNRKLINVIKNSWDAEKEIRAIFYPLIETQEIFIVLYLNIQSQILGVYKQTTGGIKSSIIDIPLLLLGAIKHQADSMIIAHNHPSGSTRASMPDIEITKKIKEACKTHGITLLDSLIVTKDSFLSMAEETKLSGMSYPITASTPKSQTKKTLNTMITKENMKESVSSLFLSTMQPGTLKEDIESIRDITEGFTDFTITDSDAELGKFLQLTIDDLNQHIQNQHAAEKEPEKEPEVKIIPEKQISIPKAKKEKKPKVSRKTPKTVTNSANMVEVVRPEIKFIRRFVNLDSKETTSARLLAFIKTLQRAIRNRLIRKDSEYAKHIMHIQSQLIAAWQKNKDSVARFKIEFLLADKEMIEAYRKIANIEQGEKSVALLKRFIALAGKSGVKEKAKKLESELVDHVKEAHVLSNEIIQALIGAGTSLNRYVVGDTTYVRITEQNLSGLKGLGILDFNDKIKKGDLVRTFDNRRARVKQVHDKSIEVEGADGHYYSKKKVKLIAKGCNGTDCQDTLDGSVDYIQFAQLLSAVHETRLKTALKDLQSWSKPDKKKIMMVKDEIKKRKGSHISLGSTTTEHTINSTDLSAMQFHRIGFTGKFLLLIGDPSEPWSMMCWSKPGKGKTTLMIELSKYLAEVHGRKVLFVAKEEGFNYTLMEKFQRLDAMHPLISISTIIPDDLSDYNYVVIDSVTKFKLTTDQLEALKEKNKKVSFIFIFQSTGNGDYRGEKDVEHLVDVSININDEGYAKASKSRFGGHGTINVFPTGTETIYRFTTLQDAERYREKNPQLAMLKGDDKKIWLTTAAKASELTEQGYEIIHF